MKMKPRSTVKNQKAILYKRFTDIEFSESLQTVYKTADGFFWVFEKTGFRKLDNPQSEFISITNSHGLVYGNTIFYYEDSSWHTTTPNSNEYTLLSAKYSNIAKYQTNKYYLVGSFDYVRKGNREDTETQPLKGMITPLSTMTIKYWTDYLKLDHDDLLVIDDHLWSIESLEDTEKRMPNKYRIYFATINSIL